MACKRQYIYAIRIKWPGRTEPLYVGRTNQLMRRWSEHNVYRGWSAKMRNILDSAWRSGAEFDMVVLQRGCGEEWAKEREKHWVAQLKPRGNSTEGG